jgi:hypothetical protein
MPTDPMSHKDALAISDAWWRDIAPGLEQEDGGMYVVVYAMCAVSGGIVGFVIGLLVG